MDATVKNIQPVDSLKLKPWQRRWINKQLKHGEKMTRAERGAETLRLAKQITSKGYQ